MIFTNDVYDQYPLRKHSKEILQALKFKKIVNFNVLICKLFIQNCNILLNERPWIPEFCNKEIVLIDLIMTNHVAQFL